MPLLVRLCSDRTAFEVRLQRRISFNMDEVKRLFEATAAHVIVVHTPYILVLRDSKGAEVTCPKMAGCWLRGSPTWKKRKRLPKRF